MLQFEDFSNEHAFSLLDQYRNRFRCFNDDIQGTGAVVVSGLISALRVSKLDLKDTRLLFFGAGSAGVGVADTIVQLFVDAGFSVEDARKHFWFVDRRVRAFHSPLVANATNSAWFFLRCCMSIVVSASHA